MILCGVYKIYSHFTGRYYIGSSKNIIRRWYRHKHDLKHGKHNNIHLQRIYNKYGEGDLAYIVLEHCSQQDLETLEQKYLDEKTKDCVNMSLLAGRIEMTSTTRAKIGAKTKARLNDKTNHPMFGKHHSHETKIKLSKANKGKKIHSEEFKLKQSRRLLGKKRIGRSYKGDQNPNHGKKHSALTRQKISENKPSCAGVYNSRYDHKIYTFVHKSGVKYTGTRFNFLNRYDVSPSGVCDLVKHRINTSKGWSIHNLE